MYWIKLTNQIRLSDSIQENETIYCLWEIFIKYKIIEKVKVKEGNNVNQANINQKKAEISKLPLEKVDIKTKTVYGNKQDHHTMIKESIYQGDVRIFPNGISPNERASKCIKQKLTNSLLQKGISKTSLWKQEVKKIVKI